MVAFLTIVDRDAYGDGPGKRAGIVIWKDGAATQLEAQWGLRPFAKDGRPFSLLRAEGADRDGAD